MGVRRAKEGGTLDKKRQKRKREDIKKRTLKMTYGNEEGLLKPTLDIWECKKWSSQASKQYIYEKEKQAGKLSLKFP